MQLANGEYNIQAKAYDTAGNIAYSADTSVTIANTRTTTATAFTVPNVDSAAKSSVEVGGDCSKDVTAQEVTVPSKIDSKALITALGFSAKCSNKGGKAQLKIDLGKQYTPSDLKVYKDQNNGTIQDVTIDTTIENRTVGGKTSTIVAYDTKEGGLGDSDGIENGTIIDPIYIVNSAAAKSKNTVAYVIVAIIGSVAGVVAIAFAARAYLRKKNEQYYSS